MQTDSNIIIHIGSPRTGTSFLRREVFPRINNISFNNKEVHKDKITEFFESLSHYGDGDELSLSLERLKLPEEALGGRKTLVSEEHLVWSVYHLFGNTGSRALLLKDRFPDAKIIITIRRQPELLLSAHNYLKTRKKTGFGKPVPDSVWQFVNWAPEASNVRLKLTGRLPTGIEWRETDAIYDVGLNYFKRHARHFAVADLSWLALYKRYRELFGSDNVLLLPLEVWRERPAEGISLLEEFVGEKIQAESIDFDTRINASAATNNAEYAVQHRFVEYIQSLVKEDNEKLNEAISYLDLAELGYTHEGHKNARDVVVGLGANKKSPSDRLIRALNSYRKDLYRSGYWLSLNMLARKTVKALVRKTVSKQALYRTKLRVVDLLKGVDFERIESTGKLSLDPSCAEQYESSKLEELKEIVEKVKLPNRIRFMDIGSGKGRVICYISTLKNVEIARGVEISESLSEVSRRNISVLGCRNCEVINIDAQDVSRDLIDDTNVFYLYNPFPRKVFEEVMYIINESMKERSSDVVIIYFNPICGDIVEKIISGIVQVRTYNNSISNAVTRVYWIKNNDA